MAWKVLSINTDGKAHGDLHIGEPFVHEPHNRSGPGLYVKVAHNSAPLHNGRVTLGISHNARVTEIPPHGGYPLYRTNEGEPNCYPVVLVWRD